MTETSPGSVCRLTPEFRDAGENEKNEFRARQGIPVPFLEIRARAAGGDMITWDDKTMGELEVRGPWVAAGYWRGGGDDKFTDDGWFKTGDLVRIDARGCIRVTDRSKDLVKSGGEWISSVDMEDSLMAHPAIAEAAVIAIPHERWGERPLAVLVLREGFRVSPDELRDHLAAHFTKWQLPDRFEFVDEIPRSATGKFNKAALRERFMQAA
jgi:fatty-acyl-CoA synthase